MKKLLIFISVVPYVIGFVGILNAAPIQWLESEGGNGNWYDVIEISMNWTDAKLAAEELSGHLATITSAEESIWLTQTFGYDFIVAHWIGAYQPSGSQEPAGGWMWVTDEVWDFSNWNVGEPNNGGDTKDEWAAVLTYGIHPENGTTWNDVNGSGLEPGFIFEIENTQPVPEPTTMLLLLFSLIGLAGFRRKFKKIQ